MSPEEHLQHILAALPEASGRFARLCAAVTDWEPLIKTAHEQCVLAVLGYFLDRADVVLPEPMHERMMDFQIAFLSRQVRMGEALHDAAAALDGAGIRAVTLKGLALADRFYPDPFIRHSSDLDLLVDECDLDRAVAALGRAGYEHLDTPTERYYRRRHHHLHLTGDGRPVVELHFHASASFGSVLPARDLLDRSVPYRTTFGANVRVLAPEDEILYLIVHALTHVDPVLHWLFDLKLFAASHPALDWSLVAGRARQWGFTRALATGIEDLRPFWNECPSPPRLGRIRRGLVERLRRVRRRGPGGRTAHTLATIGFTAAHCDTAPRAARYLGRTIADVLRRKSRRAVPTLLPEDWSG